MEQSGSGQWRPVADIDNMRVRAWMLSRIRDYFSLHSVLEVETPVLSHAGNPDVQIESFVSHYAGPGGERELYLQTSPEFAMKRLLAAGTGSIYQICKCFRNADNSRLHNPEFTMLEWYQTGFDHHQLMTDVESMLKHLGACAQETAIPRFTYQQLFETYAGFDPHLLSVEQLEQEIARLQINFHVNKGADETVGLGLDRDQCLDLILTHVIEPQLQDKGLIFVYDYPASQASLARIRPGNPAVAERFELFANGVELANGFNELTDKAEQQQRFDRDVEVRSANKQDKILPDQYLIDALDAGLAPCAGVALGLDRLLMFMTAKASLTEVLAFPFARA